MNWHIQSRKNLAALGAALLVSVAVTAAPATAAKLTKDKSASGGMAHPAPAMDYKLDIPTIDAVGSSIDDATLRDIISGNIMGHAQELADLDATSITIPIITATFSSAGADGKMVTGTVTYNDLTLHNIVDGVAADTSIASIAVDADDVKVSLGKISTGTFNISGILGVYGLVPAPADAGFKTLYADFGTEGGTVVGTNIDCKIGAMSVASFEARPLKIGFAEMMGIAAKMEATKGNPAPEDIGKALKMYADVLTAFKSAPLNFGGFDCTGKTEDGNPMAITIAGMTIGGFEPGTYPSFSFDGLVADVGAEGKFSLANFTSKAFDLSGPIAAIEKAPDAIDEAWLNANVRSLIPAYAGMSAKGFSMDAPNPDTPSERIVATLADFDLSLAAYFNGIPTDVKTSANNLVIDLPTNTKDEQLKQLVDLGVTKLDLGYGLDAVWDEATQSIKLNDLSVTGANLATIKLTGGLGNVATALFSADTNEAMATAMAIVVKSLDLDVLDSGLSDLVLKRVSAEQGSDATAMRPMFAGLAEGTIVSYLVGAAEAQNVGKAISKFIAGSAKSLHIGLTAKDVAGLGMADFMAGSEDPTSLIGKVNISATAK